MVNTSAIVPDMLARAGVTKPAAIMSMHMPWPARLRVRSCLQGWCPVSVQHSRVIIEKATA
jgi:hypothetical protein